MPILFPLLFWLLAISVAWAIPIRSHLANDDSAATRQRAIIVRPIILCDDNGENPAPSCLPKEMVDRVYTNADLEVLFLNPQQWNYGIGRRGEVDLDTIVREGRSNGKLARDRQVVDLLFVSAIDGNPGLQGRGKQNGNVCFICLGPDPDRNQPATEAFVVAHELGHCLNLFHAVDDPNVPDDVPNLQGEGPMEDRLAVTGLHDSQRDTILKSPLVNNRVHFCTKSEAEARLVDESWEPYISESSDAMLRYSLGLPADAPIPGDPEMRLQFARQKFAEFASEFTAEEKEFLTASVESLNEVAGDDWPLLCRVPWDFVKVGPGFYGNATHTRGRSIFLRPGGISYMRNRPLFALWVLAHEKIHILQRINRDAFHSFYRELGYQRFELNQESENRLVLKQNPDAFSYRWAIPIDGTLHFLATIFELTEENQFNKSHRLYPLEKIADGTYKALPAVDLAEMAPWKSRFEILESGHEDPNELIAYLAIYLISDYLGEWKPTEVNPEMLKKSEDFFRRTFSIVSDDTP